MCTKKRCKIRGELNITVILQKEIRSHFYKKEKIDKEFTF